MHVGVIFHHNAHIIVIDLENLWLFDLQTVLANLNFSVKKATVIATNVCVEAIFSHSMFVPIIYCMYGVFFKFNNHNNNNNNAHFHINARTIYNDISRLNWLLHVWYPFSKITFAFTIIFTIWKNTFVMWALIIISTDHKVRNRNINFSAVSIWIWFEFLICSAN